MNRRLIALSFQADGAALAPVGVFAAEHFQGFVCRIIVPVHNPDRPLQRRIFIDQNLPDDAVFAQVAHVLGRTVVRVEGDDRRLAAVPPVFEGPVNLDVGFRKGVQVLLGTVVAASRNLAGL